MLKEIIIAKDFKVEKLNQFNLIRAGYFSTMLLNEIYTQNKQVPIFYRKIDFSKQVNFTAYKMLLQNITNKEIRKDIGKFKDYEKFYKILFSLLKMTIQVRLDENSILLIDNIDSGISYEYQLLFLTILLCLNCQVFMTTYNPVFIPIFVEIIKSLNRESQFTYFDLRLETNKITIDNYSASQINSLNLHSFFF